MKLSELPKYYAYARGDEWADVCERERSLEARLRFACQLICRSTEYDCRDQEMVLFIAKLQDEGLFSQPTGIEVVK